MLFALRRLIFILILFADFAWAEDVTVKIKPPGQHTAQVAGVITGTIVDGEANRPVEFVAVVLKKLGGTTEHSMVSDGLGHFNFENIPAGDYRLIYSLVGTDSRATPPFQLDALHAEINFNALKLTGDVLQLEKLEVKGMTQTFLNSIDRKTYNVGREIQSATGSASDLLQNLPSVGVDIDGNISLRGSDNVMILINGRTSTLMGRSRAEILQQLPADSIDKIEVITNPSAKYKPDGTAGIINIVLKKKLAGRFSGTANSAYGNADRANGGVTLSFNPGPYAIFGSLSLRQDDRPRRASDVRTTIDPTTGAAITIAKTTIEHSRPLTRLVRGGLDWNPSSHDKLGAAANFDRRTFLRHATDHNLVSNAAGTITSDYDRIRTDPEYEQSFECSATWQHLFSGDDHELNVEVKSSSTKEEEANHFMQTYRWPVQPATFDNVINQNSGHEREVLVEYVRPLNEEAKFEAGYTLTDENFGAFFHNEILDPLSGQFITNAAKTSRFDVTNTIHAMFATYARAFGLFGFKAGLRPEWAVTTSHLASTNATIPNEYNRIYPTLHFAYQLASGHELQLNYSHRVHRPEIEELNPFPEYIDPFNLRAGNPRLKPEDIHSFEAGYGFHQGENSLTATVYHRQLYHGFTNVTRDLGNNILLTTRENLASSRSTGVEFTANANIGKQLTLNFSSNLFFNTIDASNLGFSSTKSAVAWLAKLGGTMRLEKNTLLQFNANYTSARLTPQGSRRPSFVANAGLRHDLWEKKVALVLTVADLCNSLKETTELATPTLREVIVRRRSARIIYVGILYNFGKKPKKSSDEVMKFDNSI